MPMFTSRFALKMPAALLLGLATVAGGAAEQHDVHAANTTHNLPREDSPGRWRGQLCLVNSRNCLDLYRHPPRLCLLAPDRCDTEAGRLEHLGLTH